MSGGGSDYDLDNWDSLYGPGWREKTIATLEQELKERGVLPRKSVGDFFWILVILLVLIGLVYGGFRL